MTASAYRLSADSASDLLLIGGAKCLMSQSVERTWNKSPNAPNSSARFAVLPLPASHIGLRIGRPLEQVRRSEPLK